MIELLRKRGVKRTEWDRFNCRFSIDETGLLYLNEIHFSSHVSDNKLCEGFNVVLQYTGYVVITDGEVRLSGKSRVENALMENVIYEL